MLGHFVFVFVRLNYPLSFAKFIIYPFLAFWWIGYHPLKRL